MGVDESFEVATSLKGQLVLIVRTDGTEVKGRLLAVEDLTAILDSPGAQPLRISLGDVNWITRSDWL